MLNDIITEIIKHLPGRHPQEDHRGKHASAKHAGLHPDKDAQEKAEEVRRLLENAEKQAEENRRLAEQEADSRNAREQAAQAVQDMLRVGRRNK